VPVAEPLVLREFARRGFVLRGENVSARSGKQWPATGHDLDFVFERDGVLYGGESSFVSLMLRRRPPRRSGCDSSSEHPLWPFRSAETHVGTRPCVRTCESSIMRARTPLSLAGCMVELPAGLDPDAERRIPELDRRIAVQRVAIESLLQAFVDLIPVAGPALTKFYAGRRTELQLMRLRHFAAEAGSRLRTLEERDLLDRQFLESDEFCEFFDSVATRVAQERAEEKRRHYASILAHGLVSDADRSFLASALHVLDSMDPVHVVILRSLLAIEQQYDPERSYKPLPVLGIALDLAPAEFAERFPEAASEPKAWPRLETVREHWPLLFAVWPADFANRDETPVPGDMFDEMPSYVEEHPWLAEQHRRTVAHLHYLESIGLVGLAAANGFYYGANLTELARELLGWISEAPD